MAFELRERGGDNTLDAAWFAHVGFDDDDVDLGRDLADVIAYSVELIDVTRDERKPSRAFARETQRQLAAESLRRARDKNVFAGELTHACKCSVRKLLTQRTQRTRRNTKPNISLCP